MSGKARSKRSQYSFLYLVYVDGTGGGAFDSVPRLQYRAEVDGSGGLCFGFSACLLTNVSSEPLDAFPKFVWVAAGLGA